jgi:hypothetical protein
MTNLELETVDTTIPGGFLPQRTTDTAVWQEGKHGPSIYPKKIQSVALLTASMFVFGFSPASNLRIDPWQDIRTDTASVVGTRQPQDNRRISLAQARDIARANLLRAENNRILFAEAEATESAIWDEA